MRTAPGGPGQQSRLDGVLSRALARREVRVVRRAEELAPRPGRGVLFALALDGAGQNLEYQRMLARLRLESGLLEGCTGGLIVDGPGELYTKSTAAELAPGHERRGVCPGGPPPGGRLPAPCSISASRPKTSPQI